jgi:allantoinase
MSLSDDAVTGHSYYRRDPIVGRKPWHWPNGARAAIAVVVSAEYYEMQPPANAFMPPNLPGGFGKGPYPDFRNYSARAYGNRVGIFRVLDALDRHAIKASVALDALTATLCPQLIPHIKRRDFEIIAHGQSITRMISSRMSEAEELDYISSTLATIESATGVRPRGWHGAEYGESARTPALLAKLGIDYVLDWPNDEQPLRMTTPHGPILSIPMLIDFDDVYALFHRKIPVARWRRAIEEGIKQIVEDANDSGRLLVLNLHPWLTGHPFRISFVEGLLQHLARQPHLWLTTTGEIAAWCDATQNTKRERAGGYA